MKSPINVKALLFWLLIGGLIGWQANTLFTDKLPQNELAGDPKNEEEVELELFWDVWGALEEQYIDLDKIDDEEQVYGAIAGLVESLDDPYSVFMNPEETSSFEQSINGELEGIGAELTIRNDRLTVVSPLKESPAEQAGLLPGDFIYEVDGENTFDMTLFEAIMLIRGEKGTDVTLTVLREEEEDPIEITITRDKILVPSVELEFDDSTGKKIAHLSLYQFAEDTSSEFDAAIREILLQDTDGIILDLRLNGGGFLNTSIDILGAFFDEKVKGVIVKRRNEDNEFLYTDGDGSLADIPLVVLIDEGSASASEILAGALQDYERGLLMGEQSFGKGSVQEWNTLRDGSSLKLTIAKWYTPDDRTIHEVGIEPDVLIEMESSDIDSEDDIQLQAALDFLATQ